MLRIYNTEIEKTWWPPPLSSTLLCARVTSAAMPYEAFTLVGFPKVNWSWRCKARSPPPQKTAMKNTARSSWPGLSPLYTRGSAPMDPSPTGQAIGVWCRVNQGGVSLGKPIPSSLNWFLGCWKLRYFSHIQVGGAPGQTQEMLERFCLSGGLGTPLRRWIKRRSGNLCFDGYSQNQDPGECQEKKHGWKIFGMEIKK